MSRSDANPAHGFRVDVEQHAQGAVFRLTVARPEKLNALDTGALAEISDVLARVATDDTARAVIVSGIGRARDLVLTGRIIDATQASAWGLVECVDSTRQLDTVVGDRVAMILDAGPRAVLSQKAVCRDREELPLSQAVKASIDVFGNAFRED